MAFFPRPPKAYLFSHSLSKTSHTTHTHTHTHTHWRRVIVTCDYPLFCQASGSVERAFPVPVGARVKGCGSAATGGLRWQICCYWCPDSSLRTGRRNSAPQKCRPVCDSWRYLLTVCDNASCCWARHRRRCFRTCSCGHAMPALAPAISEPSCSHVLCPIIRTLRWSKSFTHQ